MVHIGLVGPVMMVVNIAKYPHVVENDVCLFSLDSRAITADFVTIAKLTH